MHLSEGLTGLAGKTIDLTTNTMKQEANETIGSDVVCGFCISRGKLDKIILFILLYS